jgi:hypothetical protein
MEQNCKQEAYQRYVAAASKYMTPLPFEQWCERIVNSVMDIMAGC